jgi:hypothetical protein
MEIKTKILNQLDIFKMKCSNYLRQLSENIKPDSFKHKTLLFLGEVNEGEYRISPDIPLELIIQHPEIFVTTNPKENIVVYIAVGFIQDFRNKLGNNFKYLELSDLYNHMVEIVFNMNLTSEMFEEKENFIGFGFEELKNAITLKEMRRRNLKVIKFNKDE